TVSYYLRELGPIVLVRRRGSLVFDADGLRGACTASTGLSEQDRVVARDLAMRLGEASPAGTVLMSRRRPERPASQREMAATVGLSPSRLRAHLASLEAAGQIEHRDDGWVLVPHLAEMRARLSPRQRRAARSALEFLSVAHDSLCFASDALLFAREGVGPPDEPALARLWTELHRLADESRDLFHACAPGRIADEVIWPTTAHDDPVLVIPRLNLGADTW
ncbi:MAG: winged helix-turn-helix domain-containing protein, partial [Acidimicrobiales bacterium]